MISTNSHSCLRNNVVFMQGSSYTAECDESLKPAVGMTFEDIELAREFYKAYAAHVGFPVRVSQHKAKNELLINKCFYCSWEGFHKAKDETQSEPVRSGRRKCGPWISVTYYNWTVLHVQSNSQSPWCCRFRDSLINVIASADWYPFFRQFLEQCSVCSKNYLSLQSLK